MSTPNDRSWHEGTCQLCRPWLSVSKRTFIAILGASDGLSGLYLSVMISAWIVPPSVHAAEAGHPVSMERVCVMDRPLARATTREIGQFHVNSSCLAAPPVASKAAGRWRGNLPGATRIASKRIGLSTASGCAASQYCAASIIRACWRAVSASAASSRTLARLHLDEDQGAAAACDDVDLADRRLEPAREDAIALEEETGCGPALGRQAELQRRLPLRLRAFARAWSEATISPGHRRVPWIARAPAGRRGGAAARSRPSPPPPRL